MLNGSPRRLWAVIGAAGTLAIVAFGWVLLISGEKSSRADLENQAADARAQTAVSRNKLRQLDQENRKLPEYKAQLAKLAKAVPAGASTAQFVRDMQKVSQQASVTITSINITPPVAATPVAPASSGDQGSAPTTGTGSTGTTELPISIAAAGTPAHLEKFLTLLQRTESRALLVGQVVESAPDTPTGGSSASTKVQPTITVTMKAFFTQS